MLEVDLRDYLLEQQDITELIKTRLYPGWIPEKSVMPSVAFFNVYGIRHHDLDVAFPRIQFSVFSPRYLEAKEITEKIRNSLHRFKGKLGNTDVIQISFQNEYETYENDTKLYHVSSDYKIIYWEC